MAKADRDTSVRIVLVSGPAVTFTHQTTMPALQPMPGVIYWGSRVFVFAYQENPESLVYRETTMVVVQ